MSTRMLYLHALTPLHPGTGQAAGVIDLPVARRKVPGWPYVPSSSLKGVSRDACEGHALRDEAFGRASEPNGTDEQAGALIFTDAQLLCLPVRSYYGSFAWLTCPLALRLWARDRQHGEAAYRLPDLPALTEEQILLPEQGSALADAQQPGAVYLEDYDLAACTDAAATRLADELGTAAFGAGSDWRREFAARFGIVADDLFTFLTETATEIVARIKLQPDTKTAQRGGLWYEEYVPAEAIFACPLLAEPRQAPNGAGATLQQLFAMIEERVIAAERSAKALQIGGKASVGRGLVELRLV